MARVIGSLFTLSGTLGNIVFKQIRGKTVACARPRRNNRKPTECAQKHRNRFKEASAYAKSINNDDVTRAAYAKTLKKGQTVYQAAMKEYLQNTSTRLRRHDLSTGR